MSFRRLFVLFRKELHQGLKGFFLVFALVMPILLSLVLSLLMGSLFSGKPKLGVVEADGSSLGRRSRGRTQKLRKALISLRILRAVAPTLARVAPCALPSLNTNTDSRACLQDQPRALS